MDLLIINLELSYLAAPSPRFLHLSCIFPLSFLATFPKPLQLRCPSLHTRNAASTTQQLKGPRLEFQSFSEHLLQAFQHIRRSSLE